jgi:hypothetical protein
MACTREKESVTVTYRPVTAGKCNSDTAHAYHYLMPEKIRDNLPLFIILDSGGDGLWAINHIKPAVGELSCIVIGSDMIRNNFSGYEQAIEILIADACSKFPVSKDLVYLIGFSGGARMAFEFALRHAVKGVLMCGAGPSAGSFMDLPCPVYMIAGTADFNFAEMYYNPLNKPGNQPFLSDYFRGNHEWPPADRLKEGFLFLMGHNKNDLGYMLKQESDKMMKKADTLLQNHETLFALKALEKSIAFNPDNRKAKKRMEEFKENPVMAGDIRKLGNDLELESRISQAYAQATMERDSVWWAKEIKQLNLEIESHSGEQKDHYMRIKAFLGILFYSRLNNMIRKQPGNKQIEHLLVTYRGLEPDNPDVYYHFALYKWSRGNKALTQRYLSVARSLGFRDKEGKEKDFPAEVWNKSGF